MRIFDCHVASTAHDALDWENLAYFGTKAALLVAAPRGPFDVAEQLLDAIADARDTGLERARAWGVRAGAAIGVHPDAEPSRAHASVWDVLERWARGADTWAIGVLARDGLGRGDDLVVRQLALAANAGLPALVDVAGAHAREDVGWLVDEARQCGLPPNRLVFVGVDYTCLRAVIDAGARGVLRVGAGATAPGDAADMLARFGAPAFRTVVVASGAAEATADVLAIPRLARELRARGVATNDIDRVLWSNAVDGFERAKCPGDQVS